MMRLSRPRIFPVSAARWALVLAVALTAAPSRAAPDRTSHASMMRTDGHWTFDFQDADIRTVLATLARAGDVSIVANKDVEGPVTARLENVTWRQALQEILRAHGLAAAEDAAGVYRVAPAAVMQQEAIDRETAARKREDLVPLDTRLVPVAFADANELRTAIEKMLTRRGHVEVDPRTNMLVVTDIPSHLDDVEELIHKLDTSTQQVEIVAKLVDMDTGAARELGIRWTASTTGGTSTYEAEVDAPVPNAAGFFRFGSVGNNSAIDAEISALETARKAKLLSNPRIMTVNNREARILVGQRIPLIVSDLAGNPVTQLQTIGIQLRVTPHINNQSGSITLDIHPEVSDLSTQATVQGGVIINTSEADTRVVVRDGEMAVIGGLIRTVESRTREGVPLLSALPLIGNLFRYNNTTKQQRELTIFITPRIVTAAR